MRRDLDALIDAALLWAPLACAAALQEWVLFGAVIVGHVLARVAARVID